jgi:hypothetical protein
MLFDYANAAALIERALSILRHHARTCCRASINWAIKVLSIVSDFGINTNRRLECETGSTSETL